MLLLAACTGAAQTPDLVYVEPGVQVVTDWDQPVFYSKGHYWRYDRGDWFRSDYYDAEWTPWAKPPHEITRIERPYRYVRYRPHGKAIGDPPRSKRQ
jgi:hypothetical protein